MSRLAASEHIDNLVLKGGVLLAANDTRRPTNDIDFQAQALANDAETLLALVREITSTERDDGLIYDVADAIAETPRSPHFALALDQAPKKCCALALRALCSLRVVREVSPIWGGSAPLMGVSVTKY